MECEVLQAELFVHTFVKTLYFKTNKLIQIQTYFLILVRQINVFFFFGGEVIALHM